MNFESIMPLSTNSPRVDFKMSFQFAGLDRVSGCALSPAWWAIELCITNKDPVGSTEFPFTVLERLSAKVYFLGFCITNGDAILSRVQCVNLISLGKDLSSFSLWKKWAYFCDRLYFESGRSTVNYPIYRYK